MAQIWVNLRAKHKMSPPNYQPIVKSQIDSATSPLYTSGELESPSSSNGSVRVISGSFMSTTGPAKTFSPVDMLDVEFIKGNGKAYDFPLDPKHNALVMVREGEVQIIEGEGDDEGARSGNGGVNVKPMSLAITTLNSGSTLRIKPLLPTKLLILAGEPFDEPIAAMGPFVMNTREEIWKAQYDYSNGEF